MIELDCPPKRALGAAGILERLKERRRAREVIEWFRDAGDKRSPAQMGFEFSQSRPGDSGDKQLIVVQDLLDHAAALDEHAEFCQTCPANRAGQAFGCAGFIQYPITALAETWLLERLPAPDERLVWKLLRKGIQELGYDGSSVKTLRETDAASAADGSTYFELPDAPQRWLGELRVSSDQLLEMMFGVGKRIIPNHSGILLLFAHAIDRNLKAEAIQDISSPLALPRPQCRFIMSAAAEGDQCIREFVAFFHALYTAWQLNRPLFIDA